MMGSTVHSFAEMSSLLDVLKDPNRYKSQVEDLASKQKSVEESTSNLNKSMDDYRSRLNDLAKKEAENASLSKDLEERQSQLDLKETNLKARYDVLDKSTLSFQQTSSSKQKELDTREAQVRQQEADISAKYQVAQALEQEHKQLHQEASKLKADYQGKVDNLKTWLHSTSST